MSNASDFIIKNGILQKYNGAGGDVVIPDGVTVIGEEAFLLCRKVESVIIPQGVTTIESSAFARCGNLRSVTIPQGITMIKDNAFYHCNSLETVILPESVQEIENGAFDSCRALTQIRLPSALRKLGQPKTSYYHGVFSGTGLTSIDIPGSVEYIGYQAFRAAKH